MLTVQTPSQKTLQDFKNKFIGSTAPKSIQKYTGTEMIGISATHKGTDVPVFSKEHIVAITHMRR